MRLSLSTAQLERRADVPELKALRIGRRQPPPARSGWREPPPGLDELFTGYDSAQHVPPPLSAPQGRAQVREFAMPPPPPPAPPMMQAPAEPLMDMPTPAPMPRRAPQGRPSLGAAAPPPRAGGGLLPVPSAPGGPPMAKKSASMMPSMPALRRRVAKDDSEQSKERASSYAASAPMELDEESEVTGSGYGGGGLDGALPEAGAAEAPASSAGRLEPAADLLDYGELTLGGVDQPGARGRLQPHAEERLQQQLLLMGVHLHLDVFALVARFEQQAASVQDVEPPTWSVPPRQSTPHFDCRFDVEARADVPSDGVWHTVPVFSAPVGLSAEYVCVPSMEPRAFRTVRVDNRTPHALLAGPVDVTLGDEFLMTSPLPTLAPGATQRLGLGVEESLKVSRNTRFEETSGGVFGGANVLTHHVRVELANRTSQRATVEVLERVPAIPAAEKDIKVEETEVKPPWARRVLLPGELPVEGERAWKVVLQPGETQTLSATWAVRIPASKMLVGGNRRT